MTYLLDPFPTGKIDLLSYMSSLDESCLIKALSRNKLVVKFLRKLARQAFARF